MRLCNDVRRGPTSRATISYMKSEIDAAIRVPLSPSAEQEQRLQALQVAFAEVCNAIAPLVVQTGVWNRVALHHMAYRPMRSAYPALGSQMICNAIDAVSRTCRHVFQTAGSPYHLPTIRGRELPQLRFSDNCPVYLDRNTFSLKNGRASLFTLDGRMRFALDIDERAEQLFQSAKLLEILLLRIAGRYTMMFHLQVAPSAAAPAGTASTMTAANDDLMPEYLAVDGQPLALPATLAHGPAAATRRAAAPSPATAPSNLNRQPA
jgi:hypothetical protein